MIRVGPGVFVSLFDLTLPSPVTEDSLGAGGVDGVLAALLIPNRSVISERHAASAVLRAMRSFDRGNNISPRFEVEILLCLAGERQVSVALKRLNPLGLRRVSLLLVHRTRDGAELAARCFPGAEIHPFTPPRDGLLWDLRGVTTCTGDLESLAIENSVRMELERPTGI